MEAMPRADIRPARTENRDDDLPSWLLLRDPAIDEGAIRRLQQHRTLWGAAKGLPVPPRRHDERDRTRSQPSGTVNRFSVARRQTEQKRDRHCNASPPRRASPAVQRIDSDHCRTKSTVDGV